ncbi:DUF4173 domain-containing protein [Sporolactobacillus shoreae]|uniref:DUF4173 domain-containing protein n=1 Tax=Sporolactobacillus shoreae TaxID=1465501 RepID=A0A4Z0GQ99_9BACL|nr:DUF4173 domain-containing protein [Sporolactobacillus shoreae]TGA99444.1 DUF4173 domain-containing protein [Sporolactobacillus shoreae]
MENFLDKKVIDDRSHGPILRRKSTLLLLSAVLLGILVDVFFYGKSLGISYPVFVVIFYILFLWNVRKQIQLKMDFGWLLLVPILMLSLSYLFFSNLIFYALNFLAIPVLVVMQTTLITKRSKGAWYSVHFIGDILYGFFYRPFAFIALPFIVAVKAVRSKIGVKRDSTFLKVLLGFVITVPLLVLIVSLLASADEVFGHFVNQIPSFYVDINLDTLIPRILLAALVAVLSFSYIWSLIKPKSSRPLLEVNAEISIHRGIDHVIASTVLSIVNVIYVLFTFIQFSYLFGGFSLALPGNFTYSEYARRGFFELVVVTLINFSILLLLIYFTKKGGIAGIRTIQCLESLLVICTLVILLSAFVRMYLYEQMYGYTYLRVLTHAFMIFLFVLFILTFSRIWKEDIKLYRLYLLTAITAFVIINYANIDVLITKFNIERYDRTGKIDVSYLTSLSDDAISEMTVLLQAKDPAVAEKIENDLFEKKRILETKRPWQSFNIAQYRAEKVLAKYDLHPNQK